MQGLLSKKGDGCLLEHMGAYSVKYDNIQLSLYCRRSYNKPANNSHKSKEDEELEIIAKLQKETKKKIEKNEQFMKKALSSQPYMPHRSAEDNFTFPEEFHFATDERIKNAPKQEEKKKDFAETLRQHPQSPVRNIFML